MRLLTSSMKSVAGAGLLRSGFRYLTMAETFSETLRHVGQTVPLGHVAIVRGGKRVPPGRTEYRAEPTGYQFLRGSDVGAGHIKKEQLANIDKEIFDCISEAVATPDEVLLTVAGVVGKSACAGTMKDVAVTDNVSMVRPRCTDQLRPEFLMYLFLSSFMQFQMKKEMSELRQQKIGLDKLRSLRVPIVPSLEDQDSALEKIRGGFEEARLMKAKIAATKTEIDAILRAELGTAAFNVSETLYVEAEDVSQEDSSEPDEEALEAAA